MKKSRLQSIVLCMLSVLLLTGCWQEEIPVESSPSLVDSEETVSEENELIMPEHLALPYDPARSLDPLNCPDGMQQVVSSLLYEGLFRLTPAFEAEPWLCTEYSYDAETFTYVFTLRSDIVFSDGSPVTGKDVAATLNRAKISERYASRLSGVKSVSADETSITVILTAPNTAFPSLMDIPIIKAGSEKDSVPIGTGPYLFSVESSGAWLIANQTWWTGASQPTDRIALVEAADQDTKLYRFTSHNVQLITADLTGTTSIRATDNISYQDANTTILQYLGCNTTLAPMNSAAFRRLLSMGINRTHITNAFLSGHGVATQFPVSPVSALYPADLETEYTPDALATEIASLNYTPERVLTLLVNEENSFKISIAEHLAESYTAAGIPMEVRVLPWAEYIEALATGNFDLYYGEVKLSADWDLSPLLATGAVLNYGGWTNAQTDYLIASARSSSDRSAAVRALCSHLQQYSPILPLCFKSTSVLTQAHVISGLSPTMAYPFYNLDECQISLHTS